MDEREETLAPWYANFGYTTNQRGSNEQGIKWQYCTVQYATPAAVSYINVSFQLLYLKDQGYEWPTILGLTVFAPLNLLSEELLYLLCEVLLDAEDDADEAHDDGDGDEAQPERLL